MTAAKNTTLPTNSARVGVLTGARLALGCLGLVALLVLADRTTAPGVLPAFGGALFDTAFHGLVAGWIVLLAAQKRAPWRWTDAIVAAVYAGALDLDHVVAARTLDVALIKKRLDTRPPTHSLSFAVLLASAHGAASRSPSTAAVVFVALASHVVRDAATGITRLFFPWDRVFELPYPAYLGLELLLALGLWLLAPSAPPKWLP